ncbi:hypothetical protein D3C71_1046340 [compost metagenome]
MNVSNVIAGVHDEVLVLRNGSDEVHHRLAGRVGVCVGVEACPRAYAAIRIDQAHAKATPRACARNICARWVANTGRPWGTGW